ncbi:MAG TPA: hypothetical protein VKV04_19705 [Verrucomicrobiae bacterium]|nr:hypothetical protein [Verrucomicrobiae bacterium]
MKTVKKSTLALLLVTFVAGCASQQPVVVNDTVGPDLARPRINLNQGRGQLVVYSALETPDVLNSDYPTHSSYDVYDMDGKFVQRVNNRTGSFYQTPATVSLPEGKYLVKARATNHGLVSVTVMVKEGETTTLDLDASHFHQHKPTGAGQWVRLPSGEVIGMREP